MPPQIINEISLSEATKVNKDLVLSNSSKEEVRCIFGHLYWVSTQTDLILNSTLVKLAKIRDIMKINRVITYIRKLKTEEISLNFLISRFKSV